MASSSPPPYHPSSIQKHPLLFEKDDSKMVASPVSSSSSFLATKSPTAAAAAASSPKPDSGYEISSNGSGGGSSVHGRAASRGSASPKMESLFSPMHDYEMPPHGPSQKQSSPHLPTASNHALPPTATSLRPPLSSSSLSLPYYSRNATTTSVLPFFMFGWEAWLRWRSHPLSPEHDAQRLSTTPPSAPARALLYRGHAQKRRRSRRTIECDSECSGGGGNSGRSYGGCLSGGPSMYNVFLAAVSVFLLSSLPTARTILNAGNPDAKRLYDDLLSNYNKLVRPVVNTTDPLTVRIKLKLSQLIDVVSATRKPYFGFKRLASSMQHYLMELWGLDCCWGGNSVILYQLKLVNRTNNIVHGNSFSVIF